MLKITEKDFNDYQVAKEQIFLYSLMDKKGYTYCWLAMTNKSSGNEKENDWDESQIAAMNPVPDDYRGLDRFVPRK